MRQWLQQTEAESAFPYQLDRWLQQTYASAQRTDRRDDWRGVGGNDEEYRGGALEASQSPQLH